jgi:hypothetical protein
MAHSSVVIGSADRVWSSTVRLITGAGYLVVETNAGAKQIRYKATGGAFAWPQLVTVSVAPVDANEALVTVAVGAESLPSLTEGGAQRELISFVFDKLAESYQVENKPSQSDSGALASFFLVLLITAALILVVGGGTWFVTTVPFKWIALLGAGVCLVGLAYYLNRRRQKVQASLFRAKCSACNDEFDAKKEWAGKIVDCPHCNESVELPFKPSEKKTEEV